MDIYALTLNGFDSRIESHLYHPYNDQHRNIIIRKSNMEIMNDHNYLSLFFLRGFDYLMQCEFKKSINNFSNLMIQVENKDRRIFPRFKNWNLTNSNYRSLDNITIYRAFFLRSLAYILMGETTSLSKNINILLKDSIILDIFKAKDLKVYPGFLSLAKTLLFKDYDKAIKQYSYIKELNSEFFGYEKNLFWLLPNKNDKYFYSVIHLLNLI